VSVSFSASAIRWANPPNDGPLRSINLGTPSWGSGQFAFANGETGSVDTATGGLPTAWFGFSVYRTDTATVNVVNRAGACR
jgi:hypothetical protein